MNIPAPTFVKVSTKGQIAIPKEFRAAAGLEAGARVMLECLADGTLALHVQEYPVQDLFGIAKHKIRTSKKQSDDDAIAASILAEDEETKRK